LKQKEVVIFLRLCSSKSSPLFTGLLSRGTVDIWDQTIVFWAFVLCIVVCSLQQHAWPLPITSVVSLPQCDSRKQSDPALGSQPQVRTIFQRAFRQDVPGTNAYSAKVSTLLFSRRDFSALCSRCRRYIDLWLCGLVINTIVSVSSTGWNSQVWPTLLTCSDF
jgi:hypothetical protein